MKWPGGVCGSRVDEGRRRFGKWDSAQGPGGLGGLDLNFVIKMQGSPKQCGDGGRNIYMSSQVPVLPTYVQTFCSSFSHTFETKIEIGWWITKV